MMTVVMMSDGAGTKTEVDPDGLTTEEEAPEFSPTEVGFELVTKLEDGTTKELEPGAETVGLLPGVVATSETGQMVVETGMVTWRRN